STFSVLSMRSVAPPGARLRYSCLFDVPQRLIDLYDPVTRLLIGRVGPDGFTPVSQGMPAERFPEAPLNPSRQGGTRTLAFSSIVYWLELEQRRVRPIFHAESGDAII